MKNLVRRLTETYVTKEIKDVTFDYGGVTYHLGIEANFALVDDTFSHQFGTEKGQHWELEDFNILSVERETEDDDTEKLDVKTFEESLKEAGKYDDFMNELFKYIDAEYTDDTTGFLPSPEELEQTEESRKSIKEWQGEKYRAKIPVSIGYTGYNYELNVLDKEVTVEYDIDIEGHSWGLSGFDILFDTIVHINVELEGRKLEDKTEKEIIVDLSQSELDWQPADGIYPIRLDVYLDDDFNVKGSVVVMGYWKPYGV